MLEIGHEGLNNMLVGFPTKAAWALCTFAYSAGPGKTAKYTIAYIRLTVDPGTEPIVFEGRTDGNIVPARGPKVFGWDAVFEPEGTGLTSATLLTCGHPSHR